MRQDLESEAERARSYPDPYPDGWYALARSEEVQGEPVTVRAVGRELVLFRRASDGTVGALDAHCPHMGAHLGLGTVEAGCVRCPFHGWRFRTDGSVATIPYADRVPMSHAARSYQVDELHGFVCVYLSRSDARCGETSAPYRLRHVAGIDEGELELRGDLDFGVVRLHLVEFAENSADLQHFQPLHGEMRLPYLGTKLPLIRVRHSASWEPDASEPHVAWFHDHAVLLAFGRVIPNTGAHARIRLDGPGSFVSFDFSVRDLGRIVMFQTHTPLAPLAQQVRFRWYAEPRVPRLLVKHVIGSWIAQWKQDIAIWETKVYRERPLLVREDGPVHALRRWYSQFYGGESTRGGGRSEVGRDAAGSAE